MNEKLYQQHLDYIGTRKIEELDIKEVTVCLERIIRCVPNGKLYKYRSIEGEAFNNAYDSLENGYIWFARADTLNDDSEICLNYNPEEEVNRIRDYLLNNPLVVLKKVIVNAENLSLDSLSDEMLKKVIDCINVETGKIEKTKAVPFLIKGGATQKQALQYLLEVEDFVNKFLDEHQNIAEEIAKDLVSVNLKLREISYVYSMSEDFDSDTMWAYYGNNNKGFCIEYDLHQIKKLSFETIKQLLSLYKIIYADKDDYSFLGHIQCFFENKKDSIYYQSLSVETMKQVITKKKAWKHEKEWRFYLCNLEHSAFCADIVSGIIIDERVISTDNAKKLIKLSKERGWNVKVRKTNILNTKHFYETLTN